MGAMGYTSKKKNNQENSNSNSKKKDTTTGVKPNRQITFPSNWNEFYSQGIVVEWHSRRHRKGRNVVARSQNIQQLSIRKKAKRYKWWSWEFKNLSWWVAQMFIWGSVAWVINGFIVWLPEITPKVDTSRTGGGVSALVGGSIFLIGASLAYLEALNIKSESNSSNGDPNASQTDNHIKNADRSSDVFTQATAENLEEQTDEISLDPNPDDSHPTHEEPNTKHLKHRIKLVGSRWHEIGYQAAVAQMFGASIFFISTVTGVPGVININNVGMVQGLYWTPQVVGGSGFIVSSLLFMHEVQPKWYQLQPKNIGWQVGFWNLVGAVGFTLCGIFGYFNFADRFQAWGTNFSTFWGGWAFLLGSYIQLLEAINKGD